MSHTYKAGEGIYFTGNSDLSGNILIMNGDMSIEVPGWAIVRFVANFVRNQRHAKLDNQGAAGILGVEVPVE